MGRSPIIIEKSVWSNALQQLQPLFSSFFMHDSFCIFKRTNCRKLFEDLQKSNVKVRLYRSHIRWRGTPYKNCWTTETESLYDWSPTGQVFLPIRYDGMNDVNSKNSLRWLRGSRARLFLFFFVEIAVDRILVGRAVWMFVFVEFGRVDVLIVENRERHEDERSPQHDGCQNEIFLRLVDNWLWRTAR